MEPSGRFDEQRPEFIKAEPDIDYFQGLTANPLLEVPWSVMKHRLTHPKQVYDVGWMPGNIKVFRKTSTRSRFRFSVASLIG